MTTYKALAAHLLMLRADVTAYARATRAGMGGSMAGNLARFLHDYAGGRCVSCGQATVQGGARGADDTAEIGHLISATYAGGKSTERQGWMPGNLANMCHICNSDAAQIDKSFEADEVIAELVPLMWPRLTKRTKVQTEYAEKARSERKW